MSEARSYARPVQLGELMTGGGVESRSSRFTPGQLVAGRAGCQEHGVLPGQAALQPQYLSPTSRGGPRIGHRQDLVSECTGSVRALAGDRPFGWFVTHRSSARWVV